MTIEKVGPLDPDQQYPSLIAGKRACPPEDCGGVPGYYRLLEVLADPRGTCRTLGMGRRRLRPGALRR